MNPDRPKKVFLPILILILLALIGVILYVSVLKRALSPEEERQRIIDSMTGQSEELGLTPKEEVELIQSMSGSKTAPTLSAEEKAKLLRSLSGQ
mgnify:CR=1 FL=1